jgi:hypothetical protein
MQNLVRYLQNSTESRFPHSCSIRLPFRFLPIALRFILRSNGMKREKEGAYRTCERSSSTLPSGDENVRSTESGNYGLPWVHVPEKQPSRSIWGIKIARIIICHFTYFQLTAWYVHTSEFRGLKLITLRHRTTLGTVWPWRLHSINLKKDTILQFNTQYNI